MGIFSLFLLLSTFFQCNSAFNWHKSPRNKKGLFMHDNEEVLKVLKNKAFLKNVPYNQLLDKIKNKEISKLYFSNNQDLVISEKKKESDDLFDDFTVTDIIPEVTTDLVDMSVQNRVEPVFKVKLEQPGTLQTFLFQSVSLFNNIVFPIIFISFSISILRMIFGANNMNRNINSLSSFNQNSPGSLNIELKKDKDNVKNSNITLSSFAGSPEIFEECTEVVSYLKDSENYKKAGAEIPKGILLEGPPGTGKTLLAKAIASETDSNFISITASEFVEVFVGVGAAKVRNLFSLARQNSPCIIFIDEFDSVGKQRGVGPGISNDEREQTLNQLLAEMDGFANNEGILVIAATNRKDTLDQALLRPGRFDRIIKVSLPDKNARLDILKVHSRNKNIAPSVNLDIVSELTSGFSGAQLKNLLNEAAIFTARRGDTTIYEKDLLDALEKLTVGLIRKIDTRSEESIKRVAVHEIGHAFLCYLFKEYFMMKKVTIQSTYNGAGGYTLFNEYHNITESGLYTKDFLKKQLVIAMGGKAAETIYYGNDFVSVGAIQDLRQANQLANRMIGNFGMGKELEPFYNKNAETMTFSNDNGYSEKLKETFDKESLELVNEALFEAKSLLAKNRNVLDFLVDKLIKSKYIYGADFEKMISDYNSYYNSIGILDAPSSEEDKCTHNCNGDCNHEDCQV